MRTRRWIATVTGASVALSAALFTAGSMTSASADITTGGSTAQPQSGQIILATNFDSSGNGYVFYVPSGTSAPVWGTLPTDPKVLQQNLTPTQTNGCIMNNPTTGIPKQLLNFTASGGNQSVVGYQPGSNGGSVGVSSKGGNATACTQVNQKERESLTLDLNNPASSLNPNQTQPVQAYDATLDIEAKGDAIVTANLYNSTSDPTYSHPETFTLYTGTSVKSGTLNYNEQNCVLAADSGPDSGSNDNCAWSIVPKTSFDRMVLSTSSPSGSAFSLEGGGDWANPAQHESVFDVITNAMGVLACGSSTPTVSDSATAPTTSIIVTRLTNGDGATCTLIPYDLAASGGTGTFHKPATGTQTAAQFTVSFTRTVATTSTLGVTSGSLVASPFTANTIAPLKINWEDSGSTTDTLTYCPAALYNSGAFYWSWLNTQEQANPGTIDMVPALTGLQYACIYGEQTTENPDGSVKVTDQVYLTGDAKFLT